MVPFASRWFTVWHNLGGEERGTLGNLSPGDTRWAWGAMRLGGRLHIC